MLIRRQDPVTTVAARVVIAFVYTQHQANTVLTVPTTKGTS